MILSMENSERTKDMPSCAEVARKIPSYIKWNADKDNPRFIPDGMNAFERNTKRVGDCLIAAVSLVVFSPLFLICYVLVKHEDGGPPSSSKSASGASDGPSPFISSEA